MALWLLTAALATVVLVSLSLLLMWVRTPHYRLQRAQVIRLLEMVCDGEASATDWTVFTGIPLRHDPELEAVRQRCLEIEERYGAPRDSGRLFPPAAMQELQDVLRDLSENGRGR